MNKLFLLSVFSFIGFSVLAQNAERTGKDYAYLFYVKSFDHGVWTSLPDTENEIQAIAKELDNSYGFDVKVESNPTKARIEEILLRAGQRDYGPNDQVLFFFSTHGYFVEDEDRGYLIPRDGKAKRNDPLRKSWLSYEDLGSYISLVKCEHIMVSLDACYSGAFGDRWKSKPSGFDEVENCPDVQTQALFNTSRLYYTSGSKKQKTPAQSKFAKAWLSVLRNGEGQIITTNELNYAFGRVGNPEPESGTFTKAHKGGDFVFFHKNACEVGQKLNQDNQHWENLKFTFSQVKLMEHLNEYPGCPHYQEALQLLTGEPTLKSVTPIEGVDTAEVADLKNMVLIKGGTFRMGSDKEAEDTKPVHSVKVGDFFLSKYEVSVGEFKKFVVETSYLTEAEKNHGSLIAEETGRRESRVHNENVNWRHNALGVPWNLNEYDNPVLHVSWNDAISYCKWLSDKTGSTYRLPTEAEWEYAAGNGTMHTKFSWGNKLNKKELVENLPDESKHPIKNMPHFIGKFKGYNDGYYFTSPVGTFSPNKFGLYDMNGNVWEWCSDWYQEDYYKNSPLERPEGPLSGSEKVLRGGAWLGFLMFQSPGVINTLNKVVIRGAADPSFKCNSIGFRVAMSN